MIRLILGRKGYGKSTLAHYMARRYSRVLAFDPRGLFRRPGATIAATRESLSDAIDALAADETMEVVYRPVDHFRAVAFPHFASEVRRWVYEERTRELAILVDEISFVNIGDEDFDQAIKACDETRQHFFLTAHRPADVPVNIRALADYWYVFQVHQEHDLDVLGERCSPAMASAASALTGRSFVGWHHAAGVTRYENPRAWFVDLAPADTLIPPYEMDAA